MIDVAAIQCRWAALSAVLDERGRRRFAAAEAFSAGRGGIKAVHEATGIARSTIGYGLRELRAGTGGDGAGRIRREGAGRKPLTQTDATLLSDLETLVSPATRGDPMSPLRWTSKSLRKLAAALRDMGHRVGHDVVGALLKQLGYSLQANRKTLEGSRHADRDAQFEHIGATVAAAIGAGQPAISVDTKKKELVGRFKNNGREYQPAGAPDTVRIHDFVDPDRGRASPYGIYDIADDTGWVSVGIDHDTAAFAVNAIRILVDEHGLRAPPRRPHLDDHRRRRRQQRLARASVEGRAAEVRRRVRADHRRAAPAAGHQQMEQDRAPALLAHHAERARPAVGRLPNHRRADRRDHLDHRPHRALRTRRDYPPGRHQGLRRRYGRTPHHPRPLPRRMELHNQAKIIETK